MTPQNLLILAAFASSFVCFLWTILIVKRGRGFYTKVETDLKRLDIKLLRNILIEALMVGGFVLLLGNFIFFVFADDWILEPAFDKLSLLMVIVFSLLYIVEHIRFCKR